MNGQQGAAAQLADAGDLPAGSFETHFTFAQALTESLPRTRPDHPTCRPRT